MKDVTVVVVPRERYSAAVTSLRSLLDHTPAEVPLVYVDGPSPAHVAAAIDAAAGHRRMVVLRASDHLSPNQARNLGFARTETELVVFVDNDVVLTPGWLEPLVAAARREGADVVGPLTLEGPPEAAVVHNAGGRIELTGADGRRHFDTHAQWKKRRLDEGGDDLVTQEVDYVELHCALVRADALRRVGGFDEGLLSTREHLDLCMSIRERTGKVVLEPASRIAYLNPPPVALGDVRFFLRRWSEAWNEASLEHFCAKHGLDRTYLAHAESSRRRRQRIVGPALDGVDARIGPDRAVPVRRVVLALERRLNRLMVPAATPPSPEVTVTTSGTVADPT